jgi:hypothetical protein
LTSHFVVLLGLAAAGLLKTAAATATVTVNAHLFMSLPLPHQQAYRSREATPKPVVRAFLNRRSRERAYALRIEALASLGAQFVATN